MVVLTECERALVKRRDDQKSMLYLKIKPNLHWLSIAVFDVIDIAHILDIGIYFFLAFCFGLGD